VTTIVAFLPLRLPSRANERGHWSRFHKRDQEQKDVARMAIAARLPRGARPPYVVRLTRIARKRLDPDNAAGSFKYVQDGVALALGVDDGDIAKVRWIYDQSISDGYACRIQVEQRETGVEP
jgi:hypothetical protein